MKFVVRSLLLVNLLLQLTSALRKCFNQDENLMLTVILLAFSVIGIIGLTLNNRFILIIFAACITLVFIASITIYVISRTERDDSQPKVPKYLSQTDQDKQPSAKSSTTTNRLTQEGRKTVFGTTVNRLATNRRRMSIQQRQLLANRSSYTTKPFLVAPLTEDYPEDGQPSSSRHQHSGRGTTASAGASASAGGASKQVLSEMKMSASVDAMSAEEDDYNQSGEPVVNKQWLAYERLQYQRYMNIISQSIDLILQTILAFWLALLLDDESDTCFGAAGGASAHGGVGVGGNATISGSGSSSSSSAASAASAARRRQSRAPNNHTGASHLNQDGPIYNYNGVRYSIRPDSAPRESLTRVATIYR